MTVVPIVLPDPVFLDRSEEYDGESLIPAERVSESEVADVYGEGVDSEIDDEIDAVEEIYAADPEDRGILQLAAQISGITEETAADASCAVLNEEILESEEEKIIEDNGISGDVSDDRQNALPTPFIPADTRREASAWLSSFVLSGIRDGAGDFDDETNLCGLDADESNGVIRTNDDLTYVLSYSTALGDHDLYRTISGTRLYLEYDLPLSASEAEFNLSAMPWLQGDGEDGKAVITDMGDYQRLVGYRELPDRTYSGGSYDVPGAGTVNCVIHIKNTDSGKRITPEFKAWIERKSDNTFAEAGEMFLCADTGPLDPTVQVSVGPFLTIDFAKHGNIPEVVYGVDKDADLLDAKNGEIIQLSGSTRAFYFVIRCGKENGSSKGVDYIDPSVPLHVEFSVSCGVDVETKTTEVGLYNVRTLGMQSGDGHVSGVFRNEDPMTPIVPGRGIIEKSSVTMKNMRIGFDISGITGYSPGSVVSEGVVSFIQEEENAGSGEEKPIYWTKLKAEKLEAACLYSGNGEAVQFPVNAAWTIENQMERSGAFDSHLWLTSSRGLNYKITSSSKSTDAAIGYGKGFNIYQNVTSTPGSEKELEKARDYFILWDNRKVMMRKGAESGNRTALESTAVYRFITKADGTLWTGDDELLSVDFTSSDVYSVLRFWPDYDAAVGFLKKLHPGEEDVCGYICGVVCESHSITEQKVGAPYYQRVGVQMKVKLIPENIRTTAIFVQSIRTYGQAVNTSYSSATGIGENPENLKKITVRNWNLSPMRYEKTRWDENGTVEEESLTALNTLHKGSTLYIEPYLLTIQEAFEDGCEAKTFEISDTPEAELVIKPGFADGPEVAEASLTVEIPHLFDREGNAVCSREELYALGKDGRLLLEAGKTYSLQQLDEGVPGEFTVLCSGEGYKVSYRGVSTGYEIPGLILKGIFDRETIANGTEVTHCSVISGDGTCEAPAAENGHLASAAFTFTAIGGVVLRECVDRAEAENGQELVYTITFFNDSGEAHLLDLTDLFPKNDDADADDVPLHTDVKEVNTEIATKLRTGAKLIYKEGSGVWKADAGSTIGLSSDDAGIYASGTVKAGETVTVSYALIVDGAAAGDLIRNSCLQRDAVGKVYSNRVETVITKGPDLTLSSTLNAGGAGTVRLYMSAFFMSVIGTAAVLAKFL